MDHATRNNATSTARASRAIRASTREISGTAGLAAIAMIAAVASRGQDTVVFDPARPVARVTIQTEAVPDSAESAARDPVDAVLVVQNHAEALSSIPALALTDELTASLSGNGFRIVNPYNAVGEDQNRTAAGEKTPDASAMKLARRLRAPAAITASIVDFASSAVGNPPLLHQYSLRMSMSLADSATGAAVCGVNVLRESPKYTGGQIAANMPRILGDLVHGAASECAAKLVAHPAVRTWRPVGLPPPPPPPADPDLTISDMDAAVQKLFAEMRKNPVFRSNYDNAQETIGRAPLVIVGGIVDLTAGKARGDDVADLLAAASHGVRMAFVNSGLFEAKDDAMVSAITKRIIESGNSPLESGDLMEALKQHGSPDFYAVGDLMFFPGETMGEYRLRLAMHDLHTGKIVWEGVDSISKPTAK